MEDLQADLIHQRDEKGLYLMHLFLVFYHYFEGGLYVPAIMLPGKSLRLQCRSGVGLAPFLCGSLGAPD